MPDVRLERPAPRVRFSVVVPFHRNTGQLRQCLAAVAAAGRDLPAGVELTEIIVVADAAVDDPTAIAEATGSRLLAIDGPRGPAVARTRGVEIARGNIMVFIDTDVVVSPSALARFGALFLAEPDLGAAMGAYDEDPDDPGFVSQCKNLAHSFVHQRSKREAQTFWGGLGAVRAEVFAAVGGFDERFGRPSVEDIDLGYRIRAAGYRIVLDPAIQGKHLKRWTFRSSIVTDVRDRGIPWTQLMHRYGMQNDLNLTWTYRACVVIAYLMALSLLAAARWPMLLAAVPFALASLWLLDRPYYRFFAARRGLVYALRWFPIHVLHHLCNGLSFAVGTLLYLSRRWTGFTLPGALPVTPWPGLSGRSSGAERHVAQS